MKKMRFISWVLLLALLIGTLPAAVSAEDENGAATDAAAEPTSSYAAGTGGLAQIQMQEAVSGDASVTSGCKTLDAAVPVGTSERILKTAKAAFLYEMDTDTVLYMYSPDTRVSPAGMVKLMTALLAVERGDMDKTVTVKESVLDLIDSSYSTAGLLPGEELTMRDLVYLCAVESGNDAAAVIADEIAGSQESFVEMMNRRAEALGCTGTKFVNVHGVDDANQYITVRDLAKIYIAGLKNTEFSTMMSAKKYTVPATNLSPEREISTSNFMQTGDTFGDLRVTGGRTCEDGDLGRGVLFTAHGGGHNILAIVMGSRMEFDDDNGWIISYGNFEEGTILLNYGCDDFNTYQVIAKDGTVAQYPVTGGENQVVAGARTAAAVALPDNVTAGNLLVKTYVSDSALNAPVKKGDVIGMVQVWYGMVCVGQSDLIAMSDVAVSTRETAMQPDLTENVSPDVGGSGMGQLLMVLGLVFLIVIVLAVVVYAYNMIRGAMIRSRRNRRRRNRRRTH